MTRQQVFDRVVEHLMTQKEQAEKDGLCMYRTPSGLSCAVGCLIPDDKYDPAIEEYGLRKDIDGEPVKEAQWVLDCLPFEVDTTMFSLLQDLQTVHDCAPDWSIGLTDVASRYSLDIDLSKYDR